MTEYAVLLTGNEAAWEHASDAERQDAYGRHEAFTARLAERGHQVTGGAELTHSREARTLRVTDDGPMVTDGPYVESAEQLGGFYLVRTDDRDDLMEVVRMLAGPDGGIEVWPLVDHGDGVPD